MRTPLAFRVVVGTQSQIRQLNASDRKSVEQIRDRTMASVDSVNHS